MDHIQLSNHIKSIVGSSSQKKIDDRVAVTSISYFCSQAEPKITIDNYLNRIAEYTNCSPACFVVAIIYMKRLAQPITVLSVHRLLLTSLLIATKFHDDTFYSNEYWSRIGGLTLKDLNQMERVFLHHINYRLFVSHDEFCMNCNLIKIGHNYEFDI